jgi:hypothetical protein
MIPIYRQTEGFKSMTVTLDAENGPEVWREASGFPNYLISNYGRIYSKPRTIARKGSAPVYTDRNRDSTAAHTITRDGRFMNPSLSKGYPRVTLRRDGQTHYVFAHQLLLLSFVGPVPEGQEVRHRNDKRADCRLSNLEYGTRAQNIADCKKNGGFRNGAAHLDEKTVRDIFSKRETHTALSVAREFSVSPSTIESIFNGRTWTHLNLTTDTRKPRVKRGSAHPRPTAKISAETALEILSSEGTPTEIGLRYGISGQNVTHIKTGRTWNHVTGLQKPRLHPAASLNPEPVIGRTPDRTAGIVDPDKV